MHEPTSPPVVLLVEDDPDHAFLTREAFIDARLAVDLRHVERGDQCLAFLRGLAPYAGMPMPDLVLLDLHLPRVSGYEVMEQVAADPALRGLPVVVLTSSSDPADAQRLAALGCAGFLPKPIDMTGFIAMVRRIADSGSRLASLTAPASAPPAPGQADQRRS